MTRLWLTVAILVASVGCRSDQYRQRMDMFSPRPVLTDPATIQSLQTQLNKAVKDWDSGADEATKIKNRDAILEASLRLSDRYFMEYDRALARGRATSDLLLDITNLFFAGAATVTRGEDAKTALAGVATFAAGTKLAINTNIFFNATTPALTAKMRALRAQKYNEILERRQQAGDDYEKYRIEDAERDLAEYYFAGTIPGAAAEISKQAKEEQEAAEEKRDLIVANQFVKDESGTQLRAWANQDPANKTALAEWLRSKNLDISAPSFYYGKQYAEQRKQAVKDLIAPE